MTEPQAAPVVKVAQNLTAIVDMSAQLLTQAVHSANDRDMPGGDAMVALGPVANPDDYAENVDAAEWRHEADPLKWGDDTLDLEHENYGDEMGAILWTLWSWTDQWRTERGYPLEGRRATIATETNFIRGSLDWAWAELNPVEWSAFEDDIESAKRGLENILRAGDRAIRGAPCMYDECGGVALYRRPKPARDAEGGKTWVLTDWTCPRCKRTWDEEGYARNIRAATEQVKREEINDEMWCADDVAAQVVGRSVKTIRTWVNRGEVAVACLMVGRRGGFVRLAEIRERHERSKRRNVA